MTIEPWHRRHAVSLASQLPENPTDALLVLEATRELLTTFMSPGNGTTDMLAANVVAFKGG